jgi:hypothetical protein
MEWLDQIKKLAKSKDYVCLAVIDQIFDYLYYIRPSVLTKHKDFFDDICERYHKDNPLDFIRRREDKESFFEKKNGVPIERRIKEKLTRQTKRKMVGCVGIEDWKSCALSKFGIDIFSDFVDGSLTRSEVALRDIEWQWFEVVDFMWERPELINPDAIDEYTAERINMVCRKRRKNNPLENGIREKFGKFWKGSDGKWYRERRVRA